MRGLAIHADKSVVHWQDENIGVCGKIGVTPNAKPKSSCLSFLTLQCEVLLACVVVITWNPNLTQSIFASWPFMGIDKPNTAYIVDSCSYFPCFMWSRDLPLRRSDHGMQGVGYPQ